MLGRSMKIGSGTEDLMVLIGLGVVAGFAARRLLQSFGTRLEQQVQQLQLQQQTHENQLYNQVQASYNQIDNFIDAFDVANDVQKGGMRD